MQTEIKLKVTYLNIVRSPKFGGKILRSTLSNHIYVYYGKNKKECIAKAERAYHFNSSYKKEWSTEIIENN